MPYSYFFKFFLGIFFGNFKILNYFERFLLRFQASTAALENSIPPPPVKYGYPLSVFNPYPYRSPIATGFVES